MAKEIIKNIKLQIPGGRANPAPPVATALGPHGINMQDFCAKFNEKTKEKNGEVTPVIVTIYKDRTFTFVLKSPPAAELLKKAARVEKGSSEPNKNKVGTVTKEQIRAIAEQKMEDLNAFDVDQAMKMVEGTARSMGILVK
ncbi:MAG: 50S ribosomal protein L11 [bacterium]|nr:50S ribosomal protein L11 [bacterium]